VDGAVVDGDVLGAGAGLGIVGADEPVVGAGVGVPTEPVPEIVPLKVVMPPPQPHELIGDQVPQPDQAPQHDPQPQLDPQLL
jgi:hypothetical protein